jgi:hypothetical protein
MDAHSTLSEKTSFLVAPNVLRFERICQLIVLLMGAQCAFAGRNLPLGADGMAYMDVARSYARHDWHTAINGYWGPLYAWLLAIGMRVFQPGIRTEFAMARGLNFALFTAALYAFSRFWRAVADWSGRISNNNDNDNDEASVPVSSPFVWIGLGYLLFVASFVWSVDTVNPDILVAALVFAISALLFKLNSFSPSALSPGTRHGIGSYAWLGLLLAVGYYAKAILLYFAVFVLVAIVIQGFRSRRLLEPITAILVFLVLVSPFVIILSRTLGHFTAGDSGRLNYVWFVNGPETKTWMKESNGGAPIPFYPGAIVFDSPRVFRLPSIAGIAYVPWYDAARFDKHSHPAFNLHDQVRQLAVNLRYPREELLGAGAALTVPLLILVWQAPKASLRHFAATWFCTLPAIAVFGMYLLVHLVQRFVLGFSLVLWGAAWASLVVPPGLQLLARRALLTGLAVFATYTILGLLHYVVSQRTESVLGDMTIAESISRYGIAPGDAVASIGDGQEAYWAHLAEVSVVAEVWSIDSEQFWSEEPEIRQAALRSMADSGAKAAVWRADSNHLCPPLWISLPERSGCMMSLH